MGGLTVPVRATKLDVPAALAAAIGKPAIIKPAGARRDLAAFPGVEAALAQAENIRDMQPSLTAALNCGEPVLLPPDNLTIRSLADGANAIRISNNVPVDVECHPRTRITVPVDGALGSYESAIFGESGSVISAAGLTTPPQTPTSPLLSFKWKGGIIDLSDHTTAFGAGGGSGGYGAMGMYGFTDVLVEDAALLTGYLPWSSVSVGGENIGSGYGDTAIGNHGCWRTVFRRLVIAGWYDQGIYNSGINNRRIGLVPNPVTFAAANTTALLTTTSAHALTVGSAVYFVSLSAVQGVTLAGRYLVTSVPSSTTFTVTAETAASGAGTGGGTAGGLAAENVDRLDADPRGIGDLIEDCTLRRCGGAVTLKRNGRQLRVTNTYIRECGDGITTKAVGLGAGLDPSSHGKQLTVDNCTFEYVQGSPIRLTGGDWAIVSNNRIKNYGKLLSTGGASFLSVPAGTGNIAAIELQSVMDAQVYGNSIKQDDPAWAAGTAGTGQEPWGIALRTDTGYKYGSSRNQVHDNHCVGVARPYVEWSANESGNIWTDNTSAGEAFPSLYNGTGTVLTEAKERTLSPDFDFTGGGTVTATISAKGQVVKSRLRFEIGIVVTALSGVSGNARLKNMPVCANNGRVSVTLARQTVTGAGAPVAWLNAASDAIGLFLDNDGSVAGIPASAFSVGSELMISGEYLIDP